MDSPTGLRVWGAAGAAVLVLACCVHRDPAQAVLQEADRAMGGVGLKTLSFSGSGTGASFGQAWQPGMAWPRVSIRSYAKVLDLENGAMQEESTRSRAEPTGGSGLPLAGERRSVTAYRDGRAWAMGGPAPTPAPVAADGRHHDLWTSPHGVLKAGMRRQATLREQGGRRVVSFTEAGRFSASVWIAPDGTVERVDSVQPNAVMGDTQTVTLYSGYRDFGGVKFPTRIRQTMGGFPVLDLDVKEARPNVPAVIDVPAPVQSFVEKVVAEKATEGVWHLAGGSHNSVLIEMADHLIVVESPLYDGRAAAVLAEAKRLVPGKPVRFVVNSHHHFDHAGGLRAAAAEGATLVTSEQARPWLERTLANPNRIAPDALAKSGRKAVVAGVNGQGSFGDSTRQVEVFTIEDSGHAQGFLVVWLPRERLLIEADAYTPGAPSAPAPDQPDADNVNLVANIERLKLNPERILPLHGRIVPLSALYTAVGRRP
jgi:glyoxylase-like metal-dependent hydrolase (beta-lactamase superfamily II)